MAWYDDILNKAKNIVPDNVNIFGAAAPAYADRAMELNLLDPSAVEKANKQSMFQGLLSTGLAYAAQPKNQGYGSVIPYLAKAYGTGMQAAQNPYTQLGKDLQYKQTFDEYQKKQNIENAQKRLFDPSTTTTVQNPYQANANIAPIDAANPLGLQIGPNFNQPTTTTTTTPGRVNPQALRELMGLDITAAGAALTIDDKFQAREDLATSKQSIKDFVAKYPEYGYLEKQAPSDAMTTIRSVTGPSRFKTIDQRYVYDTLNKTVKDLAEDNPTLGASKEQRGTYQEKGKLLNPQSGKAYPVSMNTATNEFTVKYMGKDVPLSDFDTVADGGKGLFGEGVMPLFKNTGDLSRGQISGDQMIKLSEKLNMGEQSSRGLLEFLVVNSDSESGFKRGYERLVRQGKIIAGIASENGLSEAEVLQAMQEGTFEGLAGANRLKIVGPGAMTEQDAARVYIALGGRPSSISSDPEVVEMLVSKILRSSYQDYKQTHENYNIQRMAGYSSYGEKPMLKLNKKQIDSIAPPVVVGLGLKDFTELTPDQYLRYKKQDRYDFQAKMQSLDYEKAESILQKMQQFKEKQKVKKELKGSRTKSWNETQEELKLKSDLNKSRINLNSILGN